MASLIRAMTRGLKEARASFNGNLWDYSIPPNWMLGGMAGGAQRRVDRRVLAISHVYSCITAITEDVSTTPLKSWEGERDGAKIISPEQPRIVTAPFGPFKNVLQGMSEIVMSLKLRGNAYLFPTLWDRVTGLPLQLQVLNPDRVQKLWDNKANEPYYLINGQRLGWDEIIHIAGPTYPGDLCGLDPLSEVARAFNYAAAIDDYGQSFFSNASTPSGYLSVSVPLSNDQADTIKAQWRAKHAGGSHHHEVAVLGGGAEFRPLTILPEAAQMLTTRQFSREDICGIFGVPGSRIQVGNINTGGGKGLTAIDDTYQRTTLNSTARRIEAVWDLMVPGGEGTFTQFDFRSTLLRVSLDAFAAYATAMRSTGVKSINELRAEQGLPAIAAPIGEDHGAPLNSNSSDKTGPTAPDDGNDNQKDGQA